MSLITQNASSYFIGTGKIGALRLGLGLWLGLDDESIGGKPCQAIYIPCMRGIFNFLPLPQLRQYWLTNGLVPNV